MVEFKKNSSTTGLYRLLYLLAFLAISGVAILLDIPVLRQLLGAILIFVLPGLLILFLLRLHKLELADKIVLTIGLSASSLLLIGWALNQALPGLGDTRPLATNTVVLSLCGLLTASAIGAYLLNKEAFCSFPFSAKLDTREKLLLLMAVFFPILSISGVKLINTSDNNFVLLAFLFLIPIFVIVVTLQRHKVSPDFYTLAIIGVSFALLSMYWLRSEHILGHDVHAEYRLFYITSLNQRWVAEGKDTLDAALSISLLPAMFQSLLHIEAQEELFKGIYTLICTFIPLTVYAISKRYIGGYYAFLAAIFLASQDVFRSAPGSARSSMAVFLFALFIMVLFHKEIRGVSQRGLLILFMLTTALSHYTTTYIFFFLVLFAYVLVLLFRKYNTSRSLTITSIILLFVIIFLWYSQLTKTPFSTGVGFVKNTILRLPLFAVEDARSPQVSTLIGRELAEKTFLSYINFVIHWVTFALIAIGVIGTIVKHRQMISSPQNETSPAMFVYSKFPPEFLALTLAGMGLLVIEVTVPYVSIGYGMTRLFAQIAVFASCFFVLGGIILSRYLRVSPCLPVLLVLLLYFMLQTGAMYEVFGIHANTLLSSKTPEYNYEYVTDEESQAAQWLEEQHVEDGSGIFAADTPGYFRLISQGKFLPTRVDYSAFLSRHEITGYLYLTRDNTVNKQIEGSFDMNDFLDVTASKNRIYSNGESEIYR